MNGINDDTTDYRAELERELSPKRSYGNGLGQRRIAWLLNGYANQVKHADAERRAAHRSGSIDHRAVLTDALVIKGYAPYRAVMLVAEFADVVAGKAVADSDHESYRIVADAISELIHAEADSDDWDGDDSEEYLLVQFLKWLPDSVRHQLCDKIRSQAVGGQYAADFADPFERNAAGQWIRKSDGAPVPWPVVKE